MTGLINFIKQNVSMPSHKLGEEVLLSAAFATALIQEIDLSEHGGKVLGYEPDIARSNAVQFFSKELSRLVILQRIQENPGFYRWMVGQESV